MTVEHISALEKRISLSLPLAEIETEVDKRLQRLSRTVRVDGFRPGKVPLKIVAQQYGASVRQEVEIDAMQKKIAAALTDSELKIAGFPGLDGEPVAENGELKFSAVFEVYPEIALADLSAVEIERAVYALADADVDKTVDILRRQRTTYETVERAAQDGDKVSVDFRGTIDGEVFAGGEGKGMDVVLGQGQTLPEFEGGIKGLKAGETKSVDVTFPEDYHGKEVAGKKAVFEITVNAVQEGKLPEVDAAFLKEFGIDDGNVDTFRAEIRGNLEREVKRRLSARVNAAVMQKLLEANSFDVPRALVERESRQMMENTWAQYEARGLKRDMIPLQPELFAEEAKRRVTLGLILAEIVDANKLEATDAQVRAQIDEFAASYEDPEEVVKHYYGNAQQLDNVRNIVLEQNVVSWVLEHAKVTEKSVEFDELMAGNQ